MIIETMIHVKPIVIRDLRELEDTSSLLNRCVNESQILTFFRTF